MATTTTTTTPNNPTTTTNPNVDMNNIPEEKKQQQQQKKLINLLRGWPAPSLLPVSELRAAADYVLSDPSIAVPVLQYGIDPGYQPLREELARWLSGVYRYHPRAAGSGEGGLEVEGLGGGVGERVGGGPVPGTAGGVKEGGLEPGIQADEIAITGGASQGLACILQSFTDPGYTRAVWVVAPCYFMACPIFEDSGFRGRLRAVPEDEGGIDLGALERGLREEGGKEGSVSSPSLSGKHIETEVLTTTGPRLQIPRARPQTLPPRHLPRRHLR
jgi:DNA-binding transcriptional MocR family regulator